MCPETVGYHRPKHHRPKYNSLLKTHTDRFVHVNKFVGEEACLYSS